jgi:hypothetical protein
MLPIRPTFSLFGSLLSADLGIFLRLIIPKPRPAQFDCREVFQEKLTATHPFFLKIKIKINNIVSLQCLLGYKFPKHFIV